MKAAAQLAAHRRIGGVLRDTLDWLPGASKVVYSTQLETAQWLDTRMARRFDPEGIGAIKFKSAAGRDIVVFGSGAIVSELVEHG